MYAKSGLIIAGGGTLTVTGNANNGITGKDTLKIEGTAVNVTAANHGINGKDCLVLKQANVTVTSGGDALRRDQRQRQCARLRPHRCVHAHAHGGRGRHSGRDDAHAL
ncbi:MAG: carbohydrate-binding domain-containing protein [Oscillospiraceae bacterium]